jgi:Ca2+-binding RTX toxin-like protein
MALQVPEDRLIILEDEINYTLPGDPNYINVWGNAKNNGITGNSLGNSLDGDAGTDTLVGGAGNDIYWVDQPNDFPGLIGDVVIERAGEGIDTVNSYVGYALGSNVENLVLFDNPDIPITHVISGTGNNLNNTITGNRHDNDLYGRAGNDALNGGLGEDTLHGGAGKDTLKGGMGRDVFVFDTKPSKATNLDRITDYNVKDDMVWLDNAIFKKLGSGTEASPRKINKSYFKVGDKAQDKNDYVLYNSKTGVLSYDADGSGTGKAVEIARFSKSLKMTYNYLFIV